MKVTPLDRILLFLTCLLAAYQVVVGINGLENIPTIVYTIAFGVLLVAALLIIILGYDVLESQVVVIVSTIIPLSLSLGLVWEYVEAWRIPNLVFTILGFCSYHNHSFFTHTRQVTYSSISVYSWGSWDGSFFIAPSTRS